MTTWIPNRSYSADAPPDVLRTMFLGLEDIWQMSHLRTVEGGISRNAVVDAISSSCRRVGLVDSREGFDAYSASSRIGMRVEAGRAHTNNDGLVAVLSAAADGAVDFLILVVPIAYKGTLTAPKVDARIRWVMASSGIQLSLDGVAVVGY
jgi:hypothetical protein